jgi:hypothetical protein
MGAAPQRKVATKAATATAAAAEPELDDLAARLAVLRNPA